MDRLVALLAYAGILAASFVFVSFFGGFAASIAGGGREDRSMLANFGIGLAGAIIGTCAWAAINGEWPEEINGGALVLSFLASIGVALLWDRRDRRKKAGVGSDLR